MYMIVFERYASLKQLGIIAQKIVQYIKYA